jgi:hypothetical protein
MKKTFDCVEMKRRGQEALRRKLAGMTPEEQTAYWDRRCNEIVQRQRKAMAERKRAD